MTVFKLVDNVNVEVLIHNHRLQHVGSENTAHYIFDTILRQLYGEYSRFEFVRDMQTEMLSYLRTLLDEVGAEYFSMTGAVKWTEADAAGSKAKHRFWAVEVDKGFVVNWKCEIEDEGDYDWPAGGYANTVSFTGLNSGTPNVGDYSHSVTMQLDSLGGLINDNVEAAIAKQMTQQFAKKLEDAVLNSMVQGHTSDTVPAFPSDNSASLKGVFTTSTGSSLGAGKLYSEDKLLGEVKNLAFDYEPMSFSYGSFGGEKTQTQVALAQKKGPIPHKMKPPKMLMKGKK